MSEPSSARSYWFHPQAEAEFIEEVERLQADDPQTALAFEHEVFGAIEQLLRHPESAPVIAERRGRRIRRKVLLRSRYNLYYFLKDDLIRIYAVAHQRRKPGYWLSRTKSQ